MKFIFAGALLRFTEYSREIDVSAPTLERAIAQLLETRPLLRAALLDGEQNLRLSHRMFLNGEIVDRRYYTDRRARDELALNPGDSVFFLTAIAGG
jgi:hypothetical protein